MTEGKYNKEGKIKTIDYTDYNCGECKYYDSEKGCLLNNKEVNAPMEIACCDFE